MSSRNTVADLTQEEIDFAEELGTQIAWAHILILRPLPASDLSLARLRVLWHLHRRGPLRIMELAALDQVSQPSATSRVNGLVKQGLVERKSDETDGRSAKVSLTPLGEKILVERLRIRAEALAARLSTLPDHTRREVHHALEVLQDLNRHLSS